MSAYLSIIVFALGLIVYLASKNTKVAEVGRIAYGAGLLVALYQFAGRMLHLP